MLVILFKARYTSIDVCCYHCDAVLDIANLFVLIYKQSMKR